MITITKKLDMSPHGIPQVIHVSQYDSDFSIQFKLYASVGTLSIESGTTAEIRGTKGSGTGYSASATLNTSNGTVTVAGSEQMTAVAGRNTFEIVLKKSGKVLGSANFILLVERAALDADTITDASVLRELEAIVEGAETATQAAEEAEDAADRAEAAAQTLVIDPVPTHGSSNAVRSGGVYEELQSAGLSEDAKVALLACFEHVAWTDEHGQDYYDALESALYADQYPKITAALNLGNHIIYTDDSLETLRNYLTVVYYEDRDSAGEVITNYSLSGTFVDGASAITISYSGLHTIISVPSYQEIAWINGYDSNNNNAANYHVAPFIYGSDNADYDYNRRVCAIEGNFSVSGKITIGKYKADIYNGKTFDIQDNWESVISITVPSTGRQKIRFTPFTLNDTEYLTVGENSYMGGTDGAIWYYGGNGASKGFFASEYNTGKFSAVGSSLGLNVYSIRG